MATPIESVMPHKISEVVCLKCLSRWICARPDVVLLKNIKCPHCDTVGLVIETGQSLTGDWGDE